MSIRFICGIVACAAVLGAAASVARGDPAGSAVPGAGVLTYHGDPGRSGNFVVPGLTADKARTLRLDTAFHAAVQGHVYAQPLSWHPPGAAGAMLIVATEDNVVHALDAASGREIWRRDLGKPVPASALPCGNISPLGITGTPVIDAGSGTLYVDANTDAGRGPHHLVFALDLKDGAPRPGWPVDVPAVLAARHQPFPSAAQNQRGALAILGGRVFIPFGGNFGDCGAYHGVIVGIALSNPGDVVSFETRARGGGIWAPGGLASDGRALFAATGNTFGTSSWSDGEAVFRFAPDLRRPQDPRDFFVPSDWHALDERDLDMSGSNPMPLDVPGPGGTRALLLALGKDRKAYLLDRDNLGGIGNSLAVETVARNAIITGPAAFPAADGMLVVFHAAGSRCPAGAEGAGVTVLKITASPPRLATAWCAALHGAGSAIVTTTDGRSDPIVWILGAEGDDRLHAFAGDTGAPLATVPAQPLAGLRHFATVIAAEGRLYAAADGHVYAFAF